MWPLILDMTKEESVQSLRCLELEAYASLVTALRAQGPLNVDKLNLLRDTGHVLNITQERHKAEVRRAVNDEKLSTIAYHVSGQNGYSEDWAQEGRRVIPLMPRTAPQTAYSAIADEVADTASLNNKQLPLPAATERKRSQNQQVQSNVPENSKNVQFRIPDPPKLEDGKKRKLPLFAENSNLAHHLMGPPKISKIQQIYRQRTKARLKEQQLHIKMKQQEQDHQFRTFQNVQSPKLPLSPNASPANSPKINILQNVSIQPSPADEESVEQIRNDINNFRKVPDKNSLSPQPGCSNENQAPRPKQVVANNKNNQTLTIKPMSSPSAANEVQKAIKICPRKSIAKTMSPGQKLIVVSNAHTLTSNSILQRTLTIPFVKNLSVKNFDKFKIVTTTSATPNVQVPTTTSNPSCYTTNSMKHKVVTVRTNSATKKVSLSHLQVLNAKGSIKVLPFGGKILAKTAANPNNSSLYIMNTVEGAPTKSTTSLPVVMTSKSLDGGGETLSEDGGAKEMPPIVAEVDESSSEGVVLPEKKLQETQKSSVLEEILKASGVTPSDAEHFTDDIESQISQLTEIPPQIVGESVNNGVLEIVTKAADVPEIDVTVVEPVEEIASAVVEEVQEISHNEVIELANCGADQIVMPEEELDKMQECLGQAPCVNDSVFAHPDESVPEEALDTSHECN